MSKETFESHFIAHEVLHRRAIERDTWGHLAPEENKVYSGFILFTHGCCGDIVEIDYDFGTLEASPWFFEDYHEFIDKYLDRLKDSRGKVFLFKGTYVKRKSGRFKFSGKIRRVKIDTR